MSGQREREGHVGMIQRPSPGLVRPVIMIFLTSVLMTAGLVLYAAQMQNEAALAQSVRSAQSLIDVRMRILRRVLTDHARWNEDAVANLLVSYDQAWADYNLGQEFLTNHDLSAVVVVGADGGIIYGWADGRRRLDFDLGVFGPGLQPMLDEVRAASAGTPAVSTSPLTFGQDVPHLVGVGRLVDPGSGVPGGDAAVLIVARRLDSRLITDLAESYGLHQLATVPASRTLDPPFLLLRDKTGRPVTYLDWTLTLPGRRLVMEVLPIILAAQALMGGLLYVFMARARRVAGGIVADRERIAQQADALRIREAELRAILDSVGEGILTIDAAGRIVGSNPKGREILLLPAVDGGEIRFADRLAEPSSADRILERALDVGEDITVQATRTGGAPFEAEISVTAIGDSDLRVVVLRDVTERRRAQQTLDLLATGMMLVDGSGRLLLANRSAERLIETGEVIGLSRGIVTAARENGLFSRAIALACGDRPSSSVVQLLRPDGRRPIAALVSPIDDRERAGAACSIFLRDPEIRWGVSAAALAALFGLTPAEARVVVELVAGKGLQEMANEFDLSINTVRNQLKQVYRKTSTSRQSELVSLVLAGPAFQPEAPDR